MMRSAAGRGRSQASRSSRAAPHGSGSARNACAPRFQRLALAPATCFNIALGGKLRGAASACPIHEASSRRGLSGWGRSSFPPSGALLIAPSAASQVRSTPATSSQASRPQGPRLRPTPGNARAPPTTSKGRDAQRVPPTARAQHENRTPLPPGPAFTGFGSPRDGAAAAAPSWPPALPATASRYREQARVSWRPLSPSRCG